MDPTRATSPAGSNDTPPPDLPHSMLFVPKFTKAREPLPLNRDGTPVHPELNREPSPADVPPPPPPRARPSRPPRARASRTHRRPGGGARVIGTISRTLSPPSPAPSPASSARTLDTRPTHAVERVAAARPRRAPRRGGTRADEGAPSARHARNARHSQARRPSWPRGSACHHVTNADYAPTATTPRFARRRTAGRCGVMSLPQVKGKRVLARRCHRPVRSTG